MNGMKRAICMAALLVGIVLAAGAGGAEPDIRRFDGKTVTSARIDDEAQRMMAERQGPGSGDGRD